MQTITLWWRHEFIAIAAAALCIACLARYIDNFTMNAEQKTLLHIEKIEERIKTWASVAHHRKTNPNSSSREQAENDKERNKEKAKNIQHSRKKNVEQK